MNSETSYNRIEITEFGGPDVLAVCVEDSLPLPARGEVRVKVLTAGTGFTDTIIRRGQYYDVKDKPPFTLGYDWFGVVDALGEGVVDFEVGQYVADMPVIGGYTQYLCVSSDSLVAAPAGLDPAEAVAMILSYTTAYQMLTRIKELPAGSTCLVHAAAGAVGTALLELGRLRGLTMYGTASKAKHDTVRAFGAEPIDYRRDDFVAEIARLTGGQGVDVVFDTIGGKSWSRSYGCLKRGGLLIGFGALQLTTGEEKVPSLLWGFFKLLFGWRLIPDGKKSEFYNIQTRRKKYPQQFKDDVGELFSLLKQGRLHPQIDAVVDLEHAQDVHRRIDSADISGKVVLRCNAY
ncbi:medium chain dehydrogenase/reductase family protein [uncultured Zhongshania sp.]|uniref:medium chain dehydrogenase/reductase family protein n=1 Tax=uncultured Zhongshania sp. TaxID=1642288 RepID=UPI0030DA66CB|tara:strand:- start:15769 stop:16809 length:1041 start_codon:yes stop_codon:yes gene_type:complete